MLVIVLRDQCNNVAVVMKSRWSQALRKHDRCESIVSFQHILSRRTFPLAPLRQTHRPPVMRVETGLVIAMTVNAQSPRYSFGTIDALYHHSKMFLRALDIVCLSLAKVGSLLGC